MSNQLLWEKGEWVFGRIVSILGLMQLLVNLINHRERTGYKPVKLSTIFQ